jgi:hypothetical protein
MIMVTDKNRDDIIRVYAYKLLDDMDFDTLYSFAYERLVDSKDLVDNEPLEQEILDHYPEILIDGTDRATALL